MHVSTLFLGSAAIATLAFLFHRKHSVLTCHELIGRMYPNQLEGLDDLTDSDMDGREFWIATHGISGLRKRWRNRIVLVRLCQVRAQIDDLTAEELMYVTTRAQALTSASLRAAFWGILRNFRPKEASEAGRIALRIYKELAYEVHALYSDDTANLCAVTLALVL